MTVLRPILIKGEIAIIPLTRGYVAVIDAADVPLIEGRNWRAKPHGCTVCAVTSVPKPGGGQVTLYLHALLLAAPAGTEVDHRDGSALNNLRSNLRVATHQQNCLNRKTRADSATGVKGVTWHARRRKWQARIVIAGRRETIGFFDSLDAAARAYAVQSEMHHGEFRRAA